MISRAVTDSGPVAIPEWNPSCERPRRWRIGLTLIAACLLSSCESAADKPGQAQGYVEGEFVYVASPLPGKLVKLSVQRGGQVAAGAPLFALDDVAEKALRDQAQRRVEQARNLLADARKGKRPTEIQSLAAQLEQARTALIFSDREFTRFEELAKTKTATAEEVDQKRSARDQDRQHVLQLEADLRTSHLGSRDDVIAASEADVRALEAALAKSEWDLSQKQQQSDQAGLVFDTLYREGEWVAAGRPVVSLLPPANIKVRAFVPETWIGKVHPGDAVEVKVDGVGDTFAGKVSYISPKAEYTPPVIYSQETRSKLVFLVEVVFEPKIAAQLHPGQPVDVLWKF